MALLPGLLSVAILLVWAAHDGGYDTDTWYWGALVLLALLVVTVLAGGAVRPARPTMVALGAFSAYVAWAYLSITWASSPGDALLGSNRSLLYLLVFALVAILPWTPRAAVLALTAWVLGVGVIGLILLVQLAGHDQARQLIQGGRLIAPTGYFNSSAAIFTMSSLAATALAARRELPVVARGLLVACGCLTLQLAVLVQSRGWLFTLPIVLAVMFLVVKDRLRVAAFAVIPLATIAAALHDLLPVFRAPSASTPATSQAAQAALVLAAAGLVAGLLVAAGDSALPIRALGRTGRRMIGAAVLALVLCGGIIGGTVATHGHPVAFVSRQWSGFSHPAVQSSTSHFATVGTGRYDFWRVSLDALVAHPIGGVGQDNFGDYYISRRRTDEEPQGSHSLEMSLLSEDGVVGSALFAVFLVAAVVAAVRVRRREPVLAAGVAGAALIPAVVWLIHGSVDWFWEMPAISGPALGFLALAGAVGPAARPEVARRRPRRGLMPLAWVVGALTVLAATAVLAFPYLSVRETSLGTDLRAQHADQALQDLNLAGELNPLNAAPGRIGGTIALQIGDFTQAKRRFDQAAAREPRGWYGWLGAGLAASALGQRSVAHHDFAVAAAVDPRDPVIHQALSRVDTHKPLSPSAALQMLATDSF